MQMELNMSPMDETDIEREYAAQAMLLLDLSSPPPKTTTEFMWEFNLNWNGFFISKYQTITIILAIGMLLGYILGRIQRACCCKRRVGAAENQRGARAISTSPSFTSTSTSSSTNSPSPRPIRRKFMKPVKQMKHGKRAKPMMPMSKNQQFSPFQLGHGQDQRGPSFYPGNAFQFNPLLHPTGNQVPHREFFPPTAPPPPEGSLPVTLNTAAFMADPANATQSVPAQRGGGGHDSIWIG